MTNTPINITIFASGSGTNAQAIFEYFKNNNDVKIKSLYANNANAYALTRAKNEGIKASSFNKNDFYNSKTVFNQLISDQIDLIILAGFMWLVPQKFIANFIILNIHPALLPNYGGKGMYGHFVHESIINNKEKESGITIHYVNNEYDKGAIIYQAKCPITLADTADSLAAKIHKLEHQYYPKTILMVVKKLIKSRLN